MVEDVGVLAQSAMKSGYRCFRNLAQPVGIITAWIARQKKIEKDDLEEVDVGNLYVAR